MIENLENIIDGKLKTVYTALPGRITAVDPPKMKVKVLIARSEKSEPLETGWIPLRSIYAGEGHGLHMIPYVSDDCVILFQDKNLNDAFVLPLSFNQKDKKPSTTREGKLRIGDILLQHKTGSNVYINPEGFIEIYEKKGNRARLTDGYVQLKTKDGQEVQAQNTCNVSHGTDKVLKQWTSLSTGSEVLVLEDKRVLADVPDKTAATNTIPTGEMDTLDRGNTKESKDVMEAFLDRAHEIPYRDYHGMKYIHPDAVTGGNHYQGIGLQVNGSKNPGNLNVHGDDAPEQSFEQVIQNPHRHALAVMRGMILKDSIHFTCLILRQQAGTPLKVGFSMKITETEAQFILNDIDYKYTEDGGSKKYMEELERLGKNMKEVLDLRDYPVED
jgi:hypothetical protein